MRGHVCAALLAIACARMLLRTLRARGSVRTIYSNKQTQFSSCRCLLPAGLRLLSKPVERAPAPLPGCHSRAHANSFITIETSNACCSGQAISVGMDGVPNKPDAVRRLRGDREWWRNQRTRVSRALMHPGWPCVGAKQPPAHDLPPAAVILLRSGTRLLGLTTKAQPQKPREIAECRAVGSVTEHDPARTKQFCSSF